MKFFTLLVSLIQEPSSGSSHNDNSAEPRPALSSNFNRQNENLKYQYVMKSHPLNRDTGVRASTAAIRDHQWCQKVGKMVNFISKTAFLFRKVNHDTSNLIDQMNLVAAKSFLQ